MFRSAILAASSSERAERLVEAAPLSRAAVRRFVAGTTREEALGVTERLVAEDLAAGLDWLRDPATEPEQAAAATAEYIAILEALAGAELTPAAEIGLRLSALGIDFDQDAAVEHARRICASASEAGTTVTLEAERCASADTTMTVLATLRADFPTTGIVLQASLRRAEADCRELAASGVRVRLCKGGYNEPETVAYQARHDVDRSYVRCMNALLSGGAYTMVATHDPRLIEIAEDRIRWFERSRDECEFQMLLGVRPLEQRRLTSLGYTVRIDVPFGTEWYPHLVRRLVERPANVGLLMRALRSRS